ncbi:S-layer protein [Candidatus Woesearchaeota archaeon]|nr:MAG: S-layer protein [Candidatus Woesearchaeota archaeon]
MIVVDNAQRGMVSLPARQVSELQVKVMSSRLAQRMLRELAKSPQYAMALARALRVHEQKVYYHLRRLEKAGLVRPVKKESVQGVQATYFAPAAAAFVLALRDFDASPGLSAGGAEVDFFAPIIENGELDGLVIVGSPDPHGPDMARSRDGYYGIDLALFLGTFLRVPRGLRVRLDTEVRSEDLQGNLVLIGGPVVNLVMGKINAQLPVYFDPKSNNAIVSRVSGKKYHGDECGLIVKAKNPFNPKKWVLVVAGRRYAGTRAVTIAFLRHFEELVLGNQFDRKIHARVVEGLDRDGDGIIDDVKFVE